MSQSKLVSLSWRGLRSQLRRRNVSPASYLDLVQLHPRGHTIAFLSRGRLFDMPLWQGPAMLMLLDQQVLQFVYLSDGRLAMVTLPDIAAGFSGGVPEPQLRVQASCSTHNPTLVPLDLPAGLPGLGLPEQMCAHPKNPALIAVTNHRLQLLLVRLRPDAPASVTVLSHRQASKQ
jgi:hypothetical protein